MNMRKIIAPCIIIVSVLISCSDEERVNKLAEYTKIFSGENSKTWKLTAFFARRVGRQEVEFNLPTCASDDRYIFYTDDLFEVSNGTFSCPEDEPDPILVSYKWSFNNANASLSMVFPHVFGYYFIPFTVKNITDDEMELEIFVNEEGTESYALILESVDED